MKDCKLNTHDLKKSPFLRGKKRHQFMYGRKTRDWFCTLIISHLWKFRFSETSFEWKFKSLSKIPFQNKLELGSRTRQARGLVIFGGILCERLHRILWGLSIAVRWAGSVVLLRKVQCFETGLGLDSVKGPIRFFPGPFNQFRTLLIYILFIIFKEN